MNHQATFRLSYARFTSGDDKVSVSDAIRLLMLRIADEKRLPFAVQVPNGTTAKALEELEAGKGKRFDNADALFEDLNI